MRLRPYISCLDFNEIKNWICDQRTHAMWCANLINYPLEKKNFEEVLYEGAIKYGDCPYVATTDEGKVVGFFCYSVNLNTDEGMLKFIMIDSNFRGKGFGKEMLSLAIKYAFEITKVRAVQLNVFSENDKAKKCYLSIGFVERSNTDKTFRFNGELWERSNMVVKRN